MSENGSQLDQFLRAELDNYIRETAQLCAIPSVSAKNQGIHACADQVVKILNQHGFHVQYFDTPGNPIIVGKTQGEAQHTLLFYNHYDVQPPEPLELWTTPPFEPALRDGALFARGAKDDKGEFISRLAAVDAVRALHDGKLPCNITFVLEGEEEIGSPHIAQFVKEHINLLECEAAIWEEGGIDYEGFPGTSLGRRGILYVEFEIETLKRDAHSGSAHIIPNAAWRLIQALNSLKDSKNKIRIPGFYEHALPPSRLDLELLESLPDYETWARETFGVTEFVEDLKGKELNRAIFNSTCNIAGLNAGYQGAGMKTVIPARASAKVDFRLVPDQNPDDIFKKLRAYLDQEGFSDVSVKKEGAMWPYKASADDPFIRLSASSAESVYRRPYRLTPLTGGSSPVYAFADPLGGIPVISAGVGYADNRTHSPDEHVRLSDFLNASRHISRIIDGFANLYRD